MIKINMVAKSRELIIIVKCKLRTMDTKTKDFSTNNQFLPNNSFSTSNSNIKVM